MLLDFDNACWPLICDFLAPEDQLPLLGLCRSVVDAPIRRDFFSRTMWRIPTDESLADRLIAVATMRPFIKRVQMEVEWQQHCLIRLPALETVRVVSHFTRGIYMEKELPDQVKHLDLCDATVCLANLSEYASDLASLSLPSSQCKTCGLKNFSGFVPELTSLTMVTAFPSDALEFREMPKLCVLNVTTQAMFSTRDLMSLPSLEELTLRGHNVSTVYPLVTIAAQLKVLDIRDAKACDGLNEVLPQLVNVRRLNIDSLNLIQEDLTPLSGLVQLEELYVHAKSDVDWSPIAGLKNLRLLSQSLGFSRLTPASVRAIEGLLKLKTLDCSDNLNALLEQLTLPQLETLTLRDFTSSSCIRFLPGKFPRLRTLETEYGKLDIKSVVQSLPKLTTLRVNKDMWMEDVVVLAELTQLEHLKLEFCYGCVKNADGSIVESATVAPVLQSSLRNLKQLRSLVLVSAPLPDASVLAELKRLRFVDLTHMPVQFKDVAGLRGHPSVTRLRLPQWADCKPLYGPDGVTLPNISEIHHGIERRCLWRHCRDGQSFLKH